jgi:hypothetical protein
MADLRFQLALATVICLTCSSAAATALRTGKVTDDSVCDLGPNTSAVIGMKVLIPAGRRPAMETEAYRRMATSFIATKCSQGQMLILQSGSSDVIDSRYLPEVAASACVVADIRRAQTTSVNEIDGQEVHGFDLRCTITKLDKLKAEVEERERTSPTDDFLLKLQQQAAADAGQRVGTPSAQAPTKKECGKMNLGSILMGGACKDQPVIKP